MHQHDIYKNRELLIISNTYVKDKQGLEHAKDDISDILQGKSNVVILPYALGNRDEYYNILSKLLKGISPHIRTTSPHQHLGEEAKVIADADAIYIGGGNTGRLNANLHAMRHGIGNNELVDPEADSCQTFLVNEIRNKAGKGTPIIGSSAGSNVQFQDVRTTNDMQSAIQKLPSGEMNIRMDALGLMEKGLYFNPHYLEKILIDNQSTLTKLYDVEPRLKMALEHQGESREERIKQILEMLPGRNDIIALKEGAYLRVSGKDMKVGGETNGLIFSNENGIYLGSETIQPGDDISHLLDRE